ncbi:MAG: alpha-2-macroglobulin, partial [Phycisphaerae bacterium]|nr:alpha-2-macroglobulin [Phycisphaerae bacterium]
MRRSTAVCLISLMGLVSITLLGGGQVTPADLDRYPDLKNRAEELIAEGSYQKAHELYAQAEQLDLSPRDARWVRFRLADTLWRSQAATQTADDTLLSRAQGELQTLIDAIPRAEDRDHVWAEAQESLGDYYWLRQRWGNWHQGWQHYQQALDWYAGSERIEWARQKYLGIVHRAADARRGDERGYYGYYGQSIPLDVLYKALKISVSPHDIAYAQYLIAMTLKNQGDWRQQQRVPELFEAVLAAGPDQDWYDDALFHYAQWWEQRGLTVRLPHGGYQYEPDFVKAVALYRRLLDEFKKGETRYYDDAKRQVEMITGAAVGVSVANTFLPGSEIQYYVNWRNVEEIEFTLYPVTLAEDVNIRKDHWNWLQTIELSGRESIRKWTYQTGDTGEHMPGAEALTLDEKLPVGAYVIEAVADGVRGRELILVTDAVLVVKQAPQQTLVYFCNAYDGSPLAGANVVIWIRYYDGKNWHTRKDKGRTDADGLALFEAPQSKRSLQVFVTALHEDRQAFSHGQSYYYDTTQPRWRIYAFTDRPAYRPGDTAKWKFIARRYEDGKYLTPAGQSLKYVIRDARGAKVEEEMVKLNAFGSAWGELELTDKMPLGEFQIEFEDNQGKNIGSAKLLRLEEYKLPEFKVTIDTPTDEDGLPKTFRVGDVVEGSIQADYYFGGPVADADVQVLIHQRPFYHHWQPPHEFGWYYDKGLDWRSYRYGEQLVKQESLKTDAAGNVVFKFETPRNIGQDFEYHIEARVTDASRREIIANATIRVTQQKYYVYLHPEHNIYRPQDRVRVDIKALDANENAQQIVGEIKVTREHWVEIWISPDGEEIPVDKVPAEVRFSIHIASARFPARTAPDEQSWKLKFRGYEREDILTQSVKTDADGNAEFVFTPPRAGYYRVAWESDDPGYGPILAETTVCVATKETEQLGYRPGGVDLIVDKDTFRTGQTAPVMLTVPTNNRYVLFAVEAEGIYSYRLVHVTGTAKLIEVPITDQHVPNIFLSAAMVMDQQLFTDNEEVIVPPAEYFLTVEVEPDRDAYEPRAEGTLIVRTRDYDGQPVAAEVALGLTDESVFYIQQDYAGDPRQFYYGDKRSRYVQWNSTFSAKQYAQLVSDEKGGLHDTALDRRMRGDLELWEKEHGYIPDGDEYLYAGGAKLARAREIAGRRGGALDALQPMKDAIYLNSRRKMSANSAQGEESEMKLGAMLDVPRSGIGGEFVPEGAVQVRSDFRATAFWQPDVVTDADGHATIKVIFPDSLTGWQATARAATAGSKFGIGTAKMRTRLPLIVRLQAPRFFLVGDKVTISAVMNNNTDEPMEVLSALEADGVEIAGFIDGESLLSGNPESVTVPANADARVDWLVRVTQPGAARLKVVGRGREHADAMERTYIVYERGIDKLVAKSGKVRGDDVTVKIDIPAERRPDSTTLTVQVTPSIAVTMLDALPYLIDYPYGCTEQTMSRFLPAVITAKTLKDFDLDPEIVANKAFGGIEQDPENLERLGGRNLDKLDDVVRASLERLYDFQRNDGGWGWWKRPNKPSDHFMSAYVVWGLTLARDAGLDIHDDALDRGVKYLRKELVGEELNLDTQAWMLHALAVHRSVTKERGFKKYEKAAYQNLYDSRDRLNSYSRALLALCAHYYGKDGHARVLVRNLANGVKLDETPDTSVIQRGEQQSHPAVIPTAHWGEDGIYYRWSDGGEEATAFALRALLAIDPENELVEPVTNWLIKNRRGAQWRSTRDTAIVVLALNDYLRVSGELQPEMEYELIVNGHSITVWHRLPDTMWHRLPDTMWHRLPAGDSAGTGPGRYIAPSRFEIDRELIRDGENEIRIVRTAGSGPIYFAVEARFFTFEEPITPAGNEIFVRRQYYKLVQRPTLLKGLVTERIPLNDHDTIVSGERVEAVITIEAKNNYEYLVFEDLKPAGFEAVQIRSGTEFHAKELKSGAVERQFGPEPEAQIEPEAQAREQTTDHTGWKPVP